MGPLLAFKFLLAFAIIDAVIKETRVWCQLHLDWLVRLTQDQEILQGWPQPCRMTISHEKHFVGACTRIVCQRL
jgi:hypothetical protein